MTNGPVSSSSATTIELGTFAALTPLMYKLSMWNMFLFDTAAITWCHVVVMMVMVVVMTMMMMMTITMMTTTTTTTTTMVAPHDSPPHSSAPHTAPQGHVPHMPLSAATQTPLAVQPS